MLLATGTGLRQLVKPVLSHRGSVSAGCLYLGKQGAEMQVSEVFLNLSISNDMFSMLPSLNDLLGFAIDFGHPQTMPHVSSFVTLCHVRVWTHLMDCPGSTPGQGSAGARFVKMGEVDELAYAGHDGMFKLAGAPGRDPGRRQRKVSSHSGQQQNEGSQQTGIKEETGAAGPSTSASGSPLFSKQCQGLTKQRTETSALSSVMRLAIPMA